MYYDQLTFLCAYLATPVVAKIVVVSFSFLFFWGGGKCSIQKKADLLNKKVFLDLTL